MAVVPYKPTPDVAAQGGGGGPLRVEASPAAFGGQIAGAVSGLGERVAQAGQAASDIALHAQQMFNEANAQGAETQYMDAATKVLHDPKTGFMVQRGNIMPQYEGATAALKAEREKIMAALPNDRQRVMFNQLTRRTYEYQLMNMGAHLDRQMVQFADAQMRGSVINSIQQGAINAADPAGFDYNYGQAVGKLRNRAQTLGWSDDQTQAELLGMTNQAVEARVTAWASADPAKAREWLQSGTIPVPGTDRSVPVREAVTPDTFAKLEQHVKAKSDQQISAAAATSAWMGQSGLDAAIDRAARSVPGANADTLRRTAMLESSGGRDKSVSSSGARGSFQFIPTTAQTYGLTNPDDDETASTAAARLQSDNRAALKAKLGRDPTEAEVYLAHQQGSGGSAALIRNPSISAIDAVAQAYPNTDEGRLKARRAILRNGGTDDMSAGQFAQMWTAKFNNVNGPPGATNNAQPLGNKADAFGRLIGEFRAGKLTPEQFDLATTRLERLYRIDATVKAESSQAAYDEYVPQALARPQFFPVDKMLDDNRLTGQQKATLQSIVNRALKGDIDKPTEVSQAKRTQLLDGIRDGTVNSPAQLLDAVAHGGLSTADYNFVKGRFDEAQTDNGRSLARQTTELFGAVEKDISATLVPGLSNPAAGLDFYRFKDFAYRKIADAQKEGAGKVAALFDPNSPDFLGSEANIKQFKSSLDDVMRNRMSGLTTGGKAPDPSAQPRAATDPATLAPQEQLKADVASGKISRAEGRRIAIEKGWIKPPPGSAENPAVVRPNMVPTTP